MVSLTDRISNFLGGQDTEADEGLRDLFITELKTIFYAERHIVDALGRQADAGTSNEVRAAFADHQNETRTHISRLESIFRILSVEAKENASHAVDGLINDAKFAVNDTQDGSLTRDASLIIAAQKLEHFEIASYGSLLTLARVLGFDQSVELLEQTLNEEKAADRRLTELAESFVNLQARKEETPGSHHESRAPLHTTDSDVTLGGPLGV